MSGGWAVSILQSPRTKGSGAKECGCVVPHNDKITQFLQCEQAVMALGPRISQPAPRSAKPSRQSKFKGKKRATALSYEGVLVTAVAVGFATGCTSTDGDGNHESSGTQTTLEAEQDGPEISSLAACAAIRLGLDEVHAERPASRMCPRGLHAAKGGSGGATGLETQTSCDGVGILVLAPATH